MNTEDTDQTPRGRVILYIAQSLDGYIATRDGGVEWLEGFEDAMATFGPFFKSIGGAVMGRATFDFSITEGPWRLGKSPCAVLTHRPIDRPPEGVFAWNGPIPDLVERLRRVASGDIWLLGGGKAIRAFLDADAIDSMRIFTLPVMLGDGIPLFPVGAERMRRFGVVSSKWFESGVVEVEYARLGGVR